MSIIDTFEILFKSNAKQTQKEIKEVGEETDKTQNKINETDKVTQQLSSTLLKVGLQGVAAFATFEGLKSGITDAINFNAALEKTHRITGENVQQLASFDAAFAQFGSNSGEFLSWFERTSQIVQKTNGDVTNIIPNLKKLADELKALPDKEAHQLFQIRAEQLGLPQDFYLTLRQGSAAIDEMVRKQNELLDVTSKTTKAGLELQSQWKAVGTEFTAAFTQASPAAKFFLNLLQELLKAARGLIDIVTFQWSDIGNINFKGLAPRTQAAIGQAITTGPLKDQSRAFWLSQGYTPAQVSALLATEQSESGFNPGAVGDGGQARGSFQWHADRRARILAATGIDVTNAGHEDQLRAAAWELESRGDAARLRGTTNPQDAAGVLTQYFERPADIAGQSQSRGLLAAQELMKFADNSPLNSLSAGGALTNNVTIGNITVHSQATDANGIAQDIHKSLNEHLTYLAANSNDGIAK